MTGLYSNPKASAAISLECDIVFCVYHTQADRNRSERLREELADWAGLPFSHPRHPARAGGPGEGEKQI